MNIDREIVENLFQKDVYKRQESPSPALTDEIRKKIRSTAVQAAKVVNYESAGTIEFLLDDSGEFFFMEMNTRIQVELSLIHIWNCC